MSHSSSFCFLAFALFIFACLSACADTDNKDGGNQAVEKAKQAIKAICDKAESNIGNAKGALDKVQQFNEATEESKFQAAEVLLQAKAAEEKNEEAAAIVENIKNSADMVSTLHKSATDDLTSTVASLSAWLSETQKVKDRCDTELLVIDNSNDKYEDTSENASYIKNNAGNLDNYNTFASKITSVVDSTEEQIKQSLTNAQLKNLQVTGIVAVTEIATIIGKAKSIIQETQNKKDKVSGIVDEMKNFCTASLIESNDIIKALFTRANDALTNATSAVQNSTNAMTDMTEQQQKADDALKNIKGATVVTDAQTEINTANGCVGKVKQILLLIQSELETVDNSVTNANVSKQNLVTALSTTTSKPSTKPGKEAEKTNVPVRQGTESDQNDTTIQPTSKDSLGHGDNSADKRKGTLVKGAQNVPTTALTGGKAPAPGAKNDSAMTVSVPLLVALIASAVLQ